MEQMSIGVDIEEVKRIRSLARNPRFLKRIFTSGEIAYSFSRKNKAQHLAVRFAAKEAVWKALSEKLNKAKRNLSHKDIGLKNSAEGKPRVVLPTPFRAWEKRLTISLSHTDAYAVAVVLFRE